MGVVLVVESWMKGFTLLVQLPWGGERYRGTRERKETTDKQQQAMLSGNPATRCSIDQVETSRQGAERETETERERERERETHTQTDRHTQIEMARGRE